MKCYNCGDTLLEKYGALQIPSDTINSYVVEKVDYFLCPSCDEIILTSEAWKKADKIESQKIQKLIGSMPITDFVGASKAASILGMSRQAIHKHRRISKGFVYSIALEGKIYYHLKSLKLFKETGDGRFNLVKKTPSSKREYILVTLPALPSQNRFREQIAQEEFPRTWKKSQPIVKKGKSYAYNN